MADATPKQIKEFFGFASASAFMVEWKVLSEEDKAYFRAAVAEVS